MPDQTITEDAYESLHGHGFSDSSVEDALWPFCGHGFTASSKLRTHFGCFTDTIPWPVHICGRIWDDQRARFHCQFTVEDAFWTVYGDGFTAN